MQRLSSSAVDSGDVDRMWRDAGKNPPAFEDFGTVIVPDRAVAEAAAEHGTGAQQGTRRANWRANAHNSPEEDVAHLQFRARVAFKLVWCPPDFAAFVLVDDAGAYLNHGAPTGALPDLRARAGNYALAKGGRYASEAEALQARLAAPERGLGA